MIRCYKLVESGHTLDAKFTPEENEDIIAKPKLSGFYSLVPRQSRLDHMISSALPSSSASSDNGYVWPRIGQDPASIEREDADEGESGEDCSSTESEGESDDAPPTRWQMRRSLQGDVFWINEASSQWFFATTGSTSLAQSAPRTWRRRREERVFR